MSSRYIVVGKEVLSKLRGDEGFMVVVPSVVHNEISYDFQHLLQKNIRKHPQFHSSLTTLEKMCQKHG